MEKPYFRRSADRLEWHTNSNCPKWPLKNYVEDEPKGPMGYMMICWRCKELDTQLSSELDSERPKGFRSLH